LAADLALVLNLLKGSPASFCDLSVS